MAENSQWFQYGRQPSLERVRIFDNHIILLYVHTNIHVNDTQHEIKINKFIDILSHDIIIILIFEVQ